MKKTILFIFCLVLAVNLQANNTEDNDPAVKKKRVLIFTKNGVFFSIIQLLKKLMVNGKLNKAYKRFQTENYWELAQQKELENITFYQKTEQIIFLLLSVKSGDF